MLTLGWTGSRGGGGVPPSRPPGGRWLALGLVALSLSACATKGDLRDVQDEIRALAAQQRETMEALTGMRTAVQDTLRGQSDVLFESRGDILRQLMEIEQNIITLQELTGQNQRALATLRDLIESQGAGRVNPQRSDPGRGLETDPGFTVDEPRTSTAVEVYNMAVTNYNRRNFSTARSAWEQFLRDYPNDELAPDARYFLADIMVQEERYDEAIQAFLDVSRLFPDAEKAPQALYRVGTTYIEMGQLEDARVYLERVIRTWPESEVAANAQARLDEIG